MLRQVRDVLALIALRLYAIGAYVVVWTWNNRVVVLAILLIIAIALLTMTAPTWMKMDGWTPYPAPNKGLPVPRDYAIYLPLMLNRYNPAPLNPKKGADAPWSCEDAAKLRISWSYNWSLNPLSCPGSLGIPMVRDRSDAAIMLANPNPRVVNGQPILLFNEPDLPLPQADIPVSEAITLSHELFLRYPNLVWISPAYSQVHPEWIVNWYNGYAELYGTPPPIKGLAIHCYSYNADWCIAYVSQQVDLARAWELDEVWVTEFAYPTELTRTYNEALFQFNLFLDYLERETLITRYAPYMTRDPGDYSEWGGGSYQNVAPLLTYRSGDLTPWGGEFAKR